MILPAIPLKRGGFGKFCGVSTPYIAGQLPPATPSGRNERSSAVNLQNSSRREAVTPNDRPSQTPARSPQTMSRLLLKAKDACEMLGGIHPRTLSRMEKAGVLRGVKLLRHKLYAAEDLKALVENLRKWNREAR